MRCNLSNKYTFTYESTESRKTAAVVVIEDAQDLGEVLATFRNFLCACGYRLNRDEDLEIFSLDSQTKSSQSTQEEIQKNKET